MSKEEFNRLKCFLKWTYDEPKHPQESMTEFTWETGIEMTINGPRLKFDENTTLNQWRESEITKWENLMKDFKKDKKVMSVDFTIQPNEKKVKEIELDKNFIKWIN